MLITTSLPALMHLHKQLKTAPKSLFDHRKSAVPTVYADCYLCLRRGGAAQDYLPPDSPRGEDMPDSLFVVRQLPDAQQGAGCGALGSRLQVSAPVQIKFHRQEDVAAAEEHALYQQAYRNDLEARDGGGISDTGCHAVMYTVSEDEVPALEEELSAGSVVSGFVNYVQLSKLLTQVSRQLTTKVAAAHDRANKADKDAAHVADVQLYLTESRLRIAYDAKTLGSISLARFRKEEVFKKPAYKKHYTYTTQLILTRIKQDAADTANATDATDAADAADVHHARGLLGRRLVPMLKRALAIADTVDRTDARAAAYDAIQLTLDLEPLAASRTTTGARGYLTLTSTNGHAYQEERGELLHFSVPAFERLQRRLLEPSQMLGAISRIFGRVLLRMLTAHGASKRPDLYLFGSAFAVSVCETTLICTLGQDFLKRPSAALDRHQPHTFALSAEQYRSLGSTCAPRKQDGTEALKDTDAAEIGELGEVWEIFAFTDGLRWDRYTWGGHRAQQDAAREAVQELATAQGRRAELLRRKAQPADMQELLAALDKKIADCDNQLKVYGLCLPAQTHQVIYAPCKATMAAAYEDRMHPLADGSYSEDDILPVDNLPGWHIAAGRPQSVVTLAQKVCAVPFDIAADLAKTQSVVLHMGNMLSPVRIESKQYRMYIMPMTARTKPSTGGEPLAFVPLRKVK